MAEGPTVAPDAPAADAPVKSVGPVLGDALAVIDAPAVLDTVETTEATTRTSRRGRPYQLAADVPKPRRAPARRAAPGGTETVRLAELGLTESRLPEFGRDEAPIHLPGVFRIDGGRRGRPPGPLDFVENPEPFVDSGGFVKLASVFEAADPTARPEAPPQEHGIPEQVRRTASSGRHARRE